MSYEPTGIKSNIVVLSDIHIGDNTPTVWYQPAIHDPYLENVCDWVVANAGAIREMVLAGDVVDMWTQPADKRPPSFADIVATNPQILGPKGFFGKVLDALEGAVTYVPGNHDMTVTAADVQTIVSAGGHAMRFASGVYSPPGEGSSVVVAHGNQYTMFNAVDPVSPWKGLPIGHFVTRMVASEWSRKLPPDKTVATLPGQGSPDGLDFWSIAWGAFAKGDVSVADALLDSVASSTGTPSDQRFILEDGSAVDLATVRSTYANLFTRWVGYEGGGSIGNLIAWRAVLADARGYYMGWFAQREAFVLAADAIVLGHTHIPCLGLGTTMVNYANSGFECPSTADMPPQAITFVIVDTTTSVPTLLTTDGTTVSTLAAEKSPVVPVGLDDSCYVRIINSSGSDLVLSDKSAEFGYFAAQPPDRIPAGATRMFWIQNKPGAAGSQGSVTYDAPSGSQQFSVACPSSSLYSNEASGGTSLRTKAGSGNWGPPGHVSAAGYPFYVEFTWDG